jgi:hypothetical protein
MAAVATAAGGGSGRAAKRKAETAFGSGAAGGGSPASAVVNQGGMVVAPVIPKFAKLEMASLKKYQVHFGLVNEQTPPNISKSELVDAVTKHFARHPKFKEAEIIAEFLHKVRSQTQELHQNRDQEEQ